MKKKTIIIVSISLVLSLLAIAVIATFPTYLFEETYVPTEVPTNTQPPVQGEDVFDIGDGTGVESVLPGIGNESTKNYETLKEEDGAKLIAETGAFVKKTVYSIDKLGAFDKKYYRARHYVRDFADDYIMYDILTQKDGKNILPTGHAKLVINIPEDFNINQIEVYYMISDGVTKLNCTIDKTKRTATIDYTVPGVYILIDKDTEAEVSKPESGSSSNKPSTNNSASNSGSSTGSSQGGSSSSGSNSGDTSSNSSTSTPSSSGDPNQETMEGWTPWY